VIDPFIDSFAAIGVDEIMFTPAADDAGAIKCLAEIVF
jgi:hypothetical protein